MGVWDIGGGNAVWGYFGQGYVKCISSFMFCLDQHKVTIDHAPTVKTPPPAVLQSR